MEEINNSFQINLNYPKIREYITKIIQLNAFGLGLKKVCYLEMFIIFRNEFHKQIKDYYKNQYILNIKNKVTDYIIPDISDIILEYVIEPISLQNYNHFCEKSIRKLIKYIHFDLLTFQSLYIKLYSQGIFQQLTEDMMVYEIMKSIQNRLKTSTNLMCNIVNDHIYNIFNPNY